MPAAYGIKGEIPFEEQHLVKEFFTLSTFDPSEWCILQRVLILLLRQRTYETFEFIAHI